MCEVLHAISASIGSHVTLSHHQSYTAMQYSGAGQQGPRKDTDSCPKKKHDMTATSAERLVFTVILAGVLSSPPFLYVRLSAG